MTDIAVDDIVLCIKKNNSEEFKKKIGAFLIKGNIVAVINQCNESETIRVAEWCKKENIYLVHKVFEKVKNITSLSFLEQYTYFDKLDQEQRSWLHIAVIQDRNIDIIRFLIEVQGISIECEDEYAYTPLHYYCQKEVYDIQVLLLLMKNQDHLTQQSKDGLTPLEFACSNHNNLELMRSIPSIDMKMLLRTIDNISTDVMEVEKYTLTTSFSTDRIWLNLLQKNDKYMLLSYIKNDENFVNKYHIEPNELMSIMKKCPENGQGILTYIKNKFFKGSHDPQLHKIISDLTGIKIKVLGNKKSFDKSALFLALVTGRFQLIPSLLRCCQFDIISYAMLTCLICKHFVNKKRFPDQVVKDIFEIKDFCEEYAIAVMYRTYTKDLSEDKKVISNHINRKSEKIMGKSILEVAYHAKCKKFLSLPSCQESLTNVWQERGFKCPQIKFWIHSFIHVIFLIILSSVVVSNLFLRISFAEGLCYTYGFGYLIEELRQIYLSVKNGFLNSYCVDAANVIDIGALFFMLIGFIIRLSLHLPAYAATNDSVLFLESKDKKLFILRLCLCISLIAFYMRVLYFASINQILGPKLKMINTMIIQNLIPLIFIFNVFMISFGVTFQSLLYPNSFYTKDTNPMGNVTFDRKSLIATVGDIFRRATFTIFDFHYTLDDIENNQNHYVTDANGRYAVYFLLIIFMVVVNVMLMNLLIALFANTVTRIITDSKLSWKSSRYGFIHEYWDRTIAPPPFNIFIIPIEIILNSLSRKSLNSKTTKYFEEKSCELSQLHQRSDENIEEGFMSYYIYQAFAMSGQRYRLIKDINDIEYEKEVHFKIIEENLKIDKLEIKKTINERFRAIESKVVNLSKKTIHSSISTNVQIM